MVEDYNYCNHYLPSGQSHTGHGLCFLFSWQPLLQLISGHSKGNKLTIYISSTNRKKKVASTPSGTQGQTQTVPTDIHTFWLRFRLFMHMVRFLTKSTTLNISLIYFSPHIFSSLRDRNANPQFGARERYKWFYCVAHTHFTTLITVIAFQIFYFFEKSNFVKI